MYNYLFEAYIEIGLNFIKIIISKFISYNF